MKIKGLEVPEPKPEVIVIPRGEDQFVFRAGGIGTIEKFDLACPRPEPKTRTFKDGTTQKLAHDPKYEAELNQWSLKRLAYTVIKSLEATDGLVWETIDMDDPETYCNYSKELIASGLTESEIARIIDCVMVAVGLNQERIDEATAAFLAGVVEAE